MLPALAQWASALLESAGVTGDWLALAALLGLAHLFRAAVLPPLVAAGTRLVRTKPRVAGGLRGRWAIVTGATDGIGKATAKQLVREHGMHVVLVSRNESKLLSTAQEMAELRKGVEIRTVALDFSTAHEGKDADAFARPVVRAIEQGNLDVALLVNNAGMSYDHAEYFEQVDGAKIEQIIALNVTSLTKLTHAVLPFMLERKSGAIVNVSSASSFVSEPFYAVYSATKAYVNNFSEALHAENAGRGVTVHAAIPFYVTTKLSKLRHTSFFVASQENYARALIRDIGYEPLRTNYWTHDLQRAIIDRLPSFVLNKILMSNGLSIRKRAHAKKAAASKSE